MRFVPAVLLVLVAACHDVVTPPPPPTIVQLLVADTAPGFWRGDSLALASLVVGAVNSDGDTVPAPAITWSEPSGFARTGGAIRAIREARGTLVASSPGVPSTTLQVAALTDLSARTWGSVKRCYSNPNSHRGVEEPPIGIDSALYSSGNGVLEYQNGDWKDLRATLTVDFVSIVFWKDGVVDTVRGSDVMQTAQDTGAAKIYLTSVENLRMEADSPRVYRAQWLAGSTWCSGFVGGGSDFILREP